MSTEENRHFRIKAFLKSEDRKPAYYPVKGWDEPVEAANAAEDWLKGSGVRGQSFVEVYFNGARRPLFVVRYLPDTAFGIWNAFDNPWPLKYVDDEDGSKELPELGITPDRPWLDPDWTGEGEEDDENTDSDADADDGRGETRMKLFARIRGNGKRRKRYETDMERGRNIFEFTVGELDETQTKPRLQERDKKIECRVVEIHDGETGQVVNVFLKLPPGTKVETEELWSGVNVKAIGIPLTDD